MAGQHSLEVHPAPQLRLCNKRLRLPPTTQGLHARAAWYHDQPKPRNAGWERMR